MIELRSQKSLTSLTQTIYTYFEDKQIPLTLSYLDFILYYSSKSYKYCGPYYIYKRIVGLLLLKDICGLIYTWRQVRGYPSRGQSTHGNAKTARKKNLLSQYRLIQMLQLFGRKKRNIFPTLIQAEYMNRLWKNNWVEEWVEASFFVEISVITSRGHAPFNPVLLAKGQTNGYTRVGRAAKLGKSKKITKAFTIGVPIFFSQWIYFDPLPEGFPVRLFIADETRKKMGKKQKKKKITKLIEKSLNKILVELISWKSIIDIVYTKKFINWSSMYLNWLFFKTTLELNFSLQYFLSFSLIYVEDGGLEQTSWESEEGSNLILPYSYKKSLISFKFMVSMYLITLSNKLNRIGFTLTQRMFLKVGLLYRYWGYLLRNLIQVREQDFTQLTWSLNQVSYKEHTLNLWKSKVTLFFYNFNKAFFKKFLSLRQLLWNIDTKGTRTKRRYKKFCSFKLKNQTITWGYNSIFYILRQLELIYSWEHLTILLAYSLIKLNKKTLNSTVQLREGDLLECCFGFLLGEYQDNISYIIEKYKLWLQRKLYQDISLNLKFFTIRTKLPLFIKLLPYTQSSNTLGYTFDYTLNTILIVYIPTYTNFFSLASYYNLSLLYLSCWRYNI